MDFKYRIQEGMFAFFFSAIFSVEDKMVCSQIFSLACFRVIFSVEYKKECSQFFSRAFF